MKLNHNSFSTPRAMLKLNVYRKVLDFVTQCEFYQTFSIKLEPSELLWLEFIKDRIFFMSENCPHIGGNMQKVLCAYVKLLPRIIKLFKNDPV